MDEHEYRKRIAEAAENLITAIDQGESLSALYYRMRGVLEAGLPDSSEFSDTPDPADVAAHARVKELKGEATMQKVVLDAANASVKILKHDNEAFRQTLEQIMYARFNTSSIRIYICRGCGRKQFAGHEPHCIINNALNPKDISACLECTWRTAQDDLCGAMAKVNGEHPSCHVTNNGYCPHFKLKTEEEPESKAKALVTICVECTHRKTGGFCEKNPDRSHDVDTGRQCVHFEQKKAPTTICDKCSHGATVGFCIVPGLLYSVHTVRCGHFKAKK